MSHASPSQSSRRLDQNVCLGVLKAEMGSFGLQCHKCRTKQGFKGKNLLPETLGPAFSVGWSIKSSVLEVVLLSA